MQTHSRTMLTVITEATLENFIVQAAEDLGAHGYTITDARGAGARGIRSAGWGHSANIRMEMICEKPIAEAIAKHLKAHYFENYAMTMFMTDVQVLRPEKF